MLLPELKVSAWEGSRDSRVLMEPHGGMDSIQRQILDGSLLRFLTQLKAFAYREPVAGALSRWQPQRWHGSQAGSAGSAGTSGAVGPVSKANLRELSSSISEHKSSECWGQICTVVAQQLTLFLIY